MIGIPCLWHPSPSRSQNVYVLFQARISGPAAGVGRLRLRVFGVSLYRLYWDGEELGEGPARFSPDRPEYDELELALEGGEHVLSVMVHDYGVHTRILMGGIPPFLQCEAIGPDGALPLEWKCRELSAFGPTERRVNGQLGWMENCDTRLLPDLRLAFDGAGWTEPVVVAKPLGEAAYGPKTIGDCLSLPVEAEEIARGAYADRFGYVDDDPPLRFLSRDLRPDVPADGFWVRYDLGRIGLYRPRIEIEAPAGTIVEAGYGETLTDGKVHPVITLSASASCNMDRWAAQGGRQTLQTFVPRGFRYLEVHVAAPSSEARVLRAEGAMRTLYDRPAGSFQCADPLLNEIWSLGARTLQACCEDALIDTPTRERGQWLGDAAVTGMETLSVVYGSLELVRRGLLQASYRRRSEDGLAAGLCPGQESYLTSYALYWIIGCVRYSRLTGSAELLREGYDTAERTLAFFFSHKGPRGTKPSGETWDFLDWGHEVAPGEINVSLNLLLLLALEEMAAWERTLGKAEQARRRLAQAEELRLLVRETYSTAEGLLAKSVPAEGENLPKRRRAGFHATVLGLLTGMFEDRTKPAAIGFVKRHIQSCFPNDPEAPRLSRPDAASDRLITPSFAHFSLQALWEAGEADFVLGQYRSCWGWMLEQGATTLLEVFDTRWSHCHPWSAAPTWQLSRYVLGLIPDPGERDSRRYRLRFRPGSLPFASGVVPLLTQQGESVSVEWSRADAGGWTYSLRTDRPLRIRIEGGTIVRQAVDGKEEDRGGSGLGEWLEVRRSLELTFFG
ncbi:family 78 glycoside hydrolase catalytic domain [Cohnella cellulosilytica]|uniref:Family 78 glycoside hydrolase catalytic domain n=1 Tax=Cohnella cellulosilytica TaxID=986710 RepID=A0ABW2F8Q9_9BACL